MADVRRDPYSEDVEALSARLSSSLSRSSPKSPIEALQPEIIPPPPPRSQAARHPLVVFLNFIVTAAVVLVVAVGGGIFAARMQFDRASGLDQARPFTVPAGAGLGAIGDELQKEGLISNKWLFVAGVWMNRQQSALKAGEYLVPARASMHDIMDAMVSGRGILYAVTIPEGLTSQQIVERLRSEDILQGDVATVPEEGTLLPETYKFTRGDTRDSVLARMQRERERVLEDIWAHRAPDLPIKTPEELVILASIVEKETALSDERSRIAAVFINRLRLNMRLQSDPTVIYGLFGGKGKPPGFKLSRADLESQNAYNTYVTNGLPKGPIANPGRASLDAVANPSRTRDLFFVADGTGGHAFAETYDEHLKNVAKWRDISANSGAAISNNANAPAAAGDGAAAPAQEQPMQISPGADAQPDPEAAPGQ